MNKKLFNKPIIDVKRLLILGAFVWVPFSLGISAVASVSAYTASSVSVSPIVLGERAFSLDDRYWNAYVTKVFKDNILLTMAYLSGKVSKGEKIDWDAIRKPFSYDFVLKPGEVFAFHDTLLPEYTGKVVKTTGVDFGAGEGFVSDGELYGDGVCHLASLIGWAARDAKLDVVAPTNHNFARIPDVPAKYGVAIYAGNAAQNLYVRNNFDKPVKFVFTYKDDVLHVSIQKNS